MPLKKSFSPHHAWRTRTPDPLPFFGIARYPETVPSGLLRSTIAMFLSPSWRAAFPNRLLKLSVTKRLLEYPRNDVEWTGWDLNRRPPPLRDSSPLRAVRDGPFTRVRELARTVRAA